MPAIHDTLIEYIDRCLGKWNEINTNTRRQINQQLLVKQILSLTHSVYPDYAEYSIDHPYTNILYI